MHMESNGGQDMIVALLNEVIDRILQFLHLVEIQHIAIKVVKHVKMQSNLNFNFPSVPLKNYDLSLMWLN